MFWLVDDNENKIGDVFLTVGPTTRAGPVRPDPVLTILRNDTVHLGSGWFDWPQLLNGKFTYG